MAEAAGLAIGVFALTGLFNSAVECFELVQLGRNLGKSFRTCQLKLDNASLRLSRWGNSLALNSNNLDSEYREQTYDSTTIKGAKDRLVQILQLFDDAKKISKKYESRIKPNGDHLESSNLRTKVDLNGADLPRQMNQLSLIPQPQAGLRQKTKWALRDEKPYRKLIEDIADLVNDLVDLFPALQEEQRIRASHNIPFRRDPDFVDRGPTLELLEQKCAPPASRTALVGFGGVGKSQLSIEYGHRFREQSPDTWIFWVHAANRTRFEQSFAEIAQAVKIPGKDDPGTNKFKLVKDWLRDERNGRWMIILDNADNIDFLPEPGDVIEEMTANSNPANILRLSEYIPQSHNGRLLVTSRNRSVALKLVDEDGIVIVEPMTELHATRLLEKKLGSLHDVDLARELAAALEYMPLAIVQAASYISQRAPRSSIQQYLSDFHKSDRKKTSLLKYEGGNLRRHWEAKGSIIVTWQLSFEYMRRSRPAATDLLSLMSFFDRQGIPERALRRENSSKKAREDPKSLNDYLNRGLEHGAHTIREGNGKDSLEDDTSEIGSDEFEDNLQMLRDYSFVTVNQDGNFEMHALVQLATRAWLAANKVVEKWKGRFIECLLAEYLAEYPAEFPTEICKDLALCRTLLLHAKSAYAQPPKVNNRSQRENWASLLNCASYQALQMGHPTDAVNMSRAAFEARDALFGAKHEDTLDALGTLASSTSLNGKEREAKSLFQQVCESRKEVQGSSHGQTLHSMNNLAFCQMNLMEVKEAEALFISVINTGLDAFNTNKCLSTIEPAVNSLVNLAQWYGQQGRLDDTENLLSCLEGVINLVPDVEKLLTSQKNSITCITWFAQGRFEEAESLLKQTIEKTAQVCGDDHPRVLNMMNNLAIVYTCQKRFELALSLGSKVLDKRKELFGELHPETVFSVGNLAKTYKEMGRDNEAIALKSICAQRFEQAFGPDHIITRNHIKRLEEWKRENTRMRSEQEVNPGSSSPQSDFRSADTPYHNINAIAGLGPFKGEFLEHLFGNLWVEDGNS